MTPDPRKTSSQPQTPGPPTAMGTNSPALSQNGSETERFAIHDRERQRHLPVTDNAVLERLMALSESQSPAPSTPAITEVYDYSTSIATMRRLKAPHAGEYRILTSPFVSASGCVCSVGHVMPPPPVQRFHRAREPPLVASSTPDAPSPPSATKDKGKAPAAEKSFQAPRSPLHEDTAISTQKPDSAMSPFSNLYHSGTGMGAFSSSMPVNMSSLPNTIDENDPDQAFHRAQQDILREQELRRHQAANVSGGPGDGFRHTLRSDQQQGSATPDAPGKPLGLGMSLVFRGRGPQ